MQINRPGNRPQKSGGWGYDWQRGAQGLISGAAAGAQTGNPWAVAGGALLGTTAGISKESTFDRSAYDQAMDFFAQRTRDSARVASDEVGAQTGASLTARGINNSELGAGIVAGNRGRITRAAEEQIAKYSGDLELALANAQAQADNAYDAQTQKGWQDLAGQIALQMLMHSLKKNPDDTTTTTTTDAVEKPETVEEVKKPKPSLGDMLHVDEDSLPKPEERRPVGMERDVTNEPARFQAPASLPGADQGTGGGFIGQTAEDYPARRPNIDTGGGGNIGQVASDYPRRVRETESVLKPEEMEAVRTIFPDLDQILADEDIEIIPPRPERVSENIELVPFDPITGKQTVQVEVLPPPLQSDGSFDPMASATPSFDDMIETPSRQFGQDARRQPSSEGAQETPPAPSAAPSRNIPTPTGTPPLRSSEWMDETRLRGLPRWMQFYFQDEGGYNAREESYQGILQDTYDAWDGKLSSDPKYVKDLANNPDAINRFYQWFLGKEVKAPWFIAENEGLMYSYSDFAMNAGPGRARQVLQRAIQKIGNAVNPSPLTILYAFQEAKIEWYKENSKTPQAHVERANRVFERAKAMI